MLEEGSVHSLLNLWAHETTGREQVFSDSRRTVNWSTLRSSILSLREELTSAGIGSGVRVAVEVGNDIESIVRLLATLSLGAATLVLDAASTTYEYERIVSKTFLAAKIVKSNNTVLAGANQICDLGAHPLDSHLVLATSGSSGIPKLVARSYASVVENSRNWGECLGLAPGVTIVITTPLAHSYAIGAGLFAALATGADLILVPVSLNAHNLLRVVERTPRPVILSVPFLYRLIAETPPVKIPKETRAISAGEPLDPALSARFQDSWGIELLDHLGTSELGQLTYPVDTGRGSVPLPGVDVKISRHNLSEKHRHFASNVAGAFGELRWRIPKIEPVYVSASGVHPCLDRGGWFASRDLGTIDSSGSVRVLSRLSTPLNVAGRKVDPVEVEDVLRNISGVSDAVVVASVDDVTRLVAFIETELELEVIQIRQHLASHLSPYKIPQRFLFLKTFPRSGTGKVKRGNLTE